MITTPLVPWTASQRTVLNPWLYNRLTELFGEVKLANAGKPFEGREQIVNGKKRIEAVEHGEQYRVNCPFCGDKRFRLSINHRYADYRWLANCFNDACLKDKQNRGILQIRILGTEFQHLGVPNSVLTGSGGGSIVLALPPAPALPVVVRADRHISFDGNVQSVSQLAVDHPARCYIQSRGFDVDRLSAEYKVAFCHDAWADDVLAVRRLTIPYYSDGFLVGWIARRIDGVQPGWYLFCAPWTPGEGIRIKSCS